MTPVIQESRENPQFQDLPGKGFPAFLQLRPHHLLCLQNFRGHGYSEDFTRKMQSVVTALRTDPDLQIQLIRGADDLCASCPHCRSGQCESANPALFDGRVSAQTGLEPGHLLTYRDFPAMTPDLLQACCAGCEWFGLCSSLRNCFLIT